MTRQTLVAFAFAFAAAGCGDDTAPSPDLGADLSVPQDLGPAGGPVSGPQDVHCSAMGDMGAIVQTTSQASCHPDVDAGVIMTDYGDTMYNTMGHDDDCKYQVSYTVTPIRENTDTTFTVTAKSNVDGSPVTGANTIAEVFLMDTQGNTHPAPNSNVMTTESPPGTYTIKPVHFDKPGMWTVRFHFFEDCLDYFPDSPHGHAAFYVSVP